MVQEFEDFLTKGLEVIELPHFQRTEGNWSNVGLKLYSFEVDAFTFGLI